MHSLAWIGITLAVVSASAARAEWPQFRGGTALSHASQSGAPVQ